MFLILPLGYINGTLSIAYPPVPPIRCGAYACLVPLYHYQPPGAMVPFWASLGFVGVLLGFFIILLGARPRVGFALGLSFSLGSMALLYGLVTLDIQKTFIITPASFLLFPISSVATMTGATLLFSYELARRGREVIDAITS